MFQITKGLATHGIGERYYPMKFTEGDIMVNIPTPSDNAESQTGKTLESDGKQWLIVDVRDMMDGFNDSWVYKEKIDITRRAVEWAKFKKHEGVVICCGAGQSRSNAIALAYLIDTGMSYEDALDLVQKNPICDIDPTHLAIIKKHLGKKYLSKTLPVERKEVEDL